MQFARHVKTYFFAVMLACSSYATNSHAGFFDNLADAFDFSKQRLEAYQKVTDKSLVDQFYFLSEDGKEEGLNKELDVKAKGFQFQKLSLSSFTVRQPMYQTGNFKSMMSAMEVYSYSPLNDEVAQRYVAFAKSRNSVVKLYKPALGEMINSMLDQHFYLQHDKNTSEWIGLDNALIEYAPNGQIVSAMTRSHQAVGNIGVSSHQYLNIYFGAGNAQYLENKIGNRYFADNFIREL